jgi:hypothetical protein
MDARAVLKVLNSLSLGELSRVGRDLDAAREALLGLGHPELGERLAEAQRSLRGGDVREFRRALANVTARLGHLA